MPSVAPSILTWARETAGFSLEVAAERVRLHAARGLQPADRLKLLELGEEAPSRALLGRMAEAYRRPLISFYLASPPRPSDRGQDFRSLPGTGRDPKSEALLAALLRDVRARQDVVRSLLVDEDAPAITFVNSGKVQDGVPAAVQAIEHGLNLNRAELRGQPNENAMFDLVRVTAERIGIFVLLIGDLGSHHTEFDTSVFRGFALADDIAPFVVVNDRDSRFAWTFTLLHEITHIWLGASGVSGSRHEAGVERFCNDVASQFLLPVQELDTVDVGDGSAEAVALGITTFASRRHLSRTMTAYRLYRADRISRSAWESVQEQFRQQWKHERAQQRDRDSGRKGGPNYYVVRRHRLGAALLSLARRSLDEGSLTPTRAALVLGVQPQSVTSLLSTNRSSE